MFTILLSFGQWDCDRLDTEQNLLNRVAQDLAVSMREHWQPDFDFLSRRNKDQCIEIAKGCGFADGHSFLGSYKKGELVNGLLRHFGQAEQAESPTAAQEKSRNWLPNVMQFPAIGPDREPEPESVDEPLAEAA